MKTRFFIKDDSINITMPNNETLKILQDAGFGMVKEAILAKLSNNELSKSVFELAQFYIDRNVLVELCKKGYKYNYDELKNAIVKLTNPIQVKKLYQEILSEYKTVTQQKRTSLENEDIERDKL